MGRTRRHGGKQVGGELEVERNLHNPSSWYLDVLYVPHYEASADCKPRHQQVWPDYWAVFQTNGVHFCIVAPWTVRLLFFNLKTWYLQSWKPYGNCSMKRAGMISPWWLSDLITTRRHNVATIMEIKDFPTRFEMFSVYYYCSPYVPIILLEISE